jgi:hypothetical protein
MEEVDLFSIERKVQSMVVHRGHGSDRQGRLRQRLARVTGFALGIAMFGTIGLSGTLAQEEDVSVGIVDAESIVNSIIEQVWTEIFGGVADDAAVSDDGDLDVGGSTGSTVTMGGDGGSVTMGGGVAVGDNYGG